MTKELTQPLDKVNMLHRLYLALFASTPINLCAIDEPPRYRKPNMNNIDIVMDEVFTKYSKDNPKEWSTMEKLLKYPILNDNWQLGRYGYVHKYHIILHDSILSFDFSGTDKDAWNRNFINKWDLQPTYLVTITTVRDRLVPFLIWRDNS